MLRSHITWLIPVALTLVSFGSNVKSATAETLFDTYEFSIDYNTLVTIEPFISELGVPDPNFVKARIEGDSTDDAPPFGLTSFLSRTYGELQPTNNPSILRYNFNSDPEVFNLTNQELLFDRYFGGPNELFGRANDSAEINFQTETISGAGTITIFDGTGIFKNATGTITFTQSDRLAPPGTPSIGLAKLNFSIRTPRTVPEPTATTTLVGLGVTGAALLLRQHRRKANFS